MTEQCHDCGKFLAFADLCFSKHHFVPLNEFGPEESWWSCPSCRDDYGGRDSDAGFAGDRNGLHPEGAAARAEGIAHPPFPSEQP